MASKSLFHTLKNFPTVSHPKNCLKPSIPNFNHSIMESSYWAKLLGVAWDQLNMEF